MTQTSLAEDALIDIIDDHEAEHGAPKPKTNSWRILVVDDDPEVHAATRFALANCTLASRSLELISAFSSAEGKASLEQHPDVAVVLLDVVMEEHDAGLKFVEWVRERGYKNLRIILRTGQPGYAPELDVIRNYDINDYRAKNELTQTRLVTAMTTAVRAFEQLCLVEEHRLNLEQFAYALAHDFKQTTRQIRIFSGKMLNAFGPDDDTGAQQTLSFLDGAARRLGGLVDAMAQYTLLNQPAEIGEVDLTAVMSDVRVAVDPFLKETGGELVVNGAGVCLGNAALLGHVVQIIVANGLQHNESEVPHVDINVSIRDAQCLVEVVDNGVGIEPRYLEEIFRPHRRLRTTKDLPATGLGLTMSRRAVEAQGGTIWCTSILGEGSKFYVSLPVADRGASEELAGAAK